MMVTPLVLTQKEVSTVPVTRDILAVGLRVTVQVKHNHYVFSTGSREIKIQ